MELAPSVALPSTSEAVKVSEVGRGRLQCSSAKLSESIATLLAPHSLRLGRQPDTGAPRAHAESNRILKLAVAHTGWGMISKASSNLQGPQTVPYRDLGPTKQ